MKLAFLYIEANHFLKGLLMSHDLEKERRELNRDIARVAWKEQEDQARQSWGHMISFGLAAMKGPSLINGAAAAGLLAFLAKVDQIGCVFWSVKVALVAFIVGMVLSAISTGIAYLAQWAFTEAARAYEIKFEHPYVFYTARNGKLERRGSRFQYLSIGLVVLGYIAFIIGAYFFVEVAGAVVSNQCS